MTNHIVIIPLALAVASALILRSEDVPMPRPYDRAYFTATFDAMHPPVPLAALPAWFDGSFGSLQLDLVPPAPAMAKGR